MRLTLDQQDQGKLSLQYSERLLKNIKDYQLHQISATELSQ